MRESGQNVGSGTNKQDMVDYEDQFQRKKRNLSWSLSLFTALIVRVRLWYAMDMPPMANNCIAVEPADGKAVRTRLPTPINQLAAKRFCTPTKNAAVSAASPAPSGFLAPPCPVGSKKSSSASAFADHSARPGSRRSHIHDPGTLSAVVVCAQKSQRLLDLDCPVPKESASGGVCGWGSEPARRVNGCGRPFQRDIAKGIASRISGQPTQR